MRRAARAGAHDLARARRGRRRSRAPTQQRLGRAPPRWRRRRALLMSLTISPWPSGADVDDQLAHRLEQRPRALEVRALAADHDRQRAVLRLGRGAGHRRVDEARCRARRSAAPMRARGRRARSSTCRRTASPRARRASAPSAPSSTRSTCAPSTTIVITTSLRSATSRGRVARRVAPCSAAHASAVLAGAVADGQLVARPGARLAACREPMIPSPMKPTRSHSPCPPPPGVSMRSRCPARSVPRAFGGELVAVEQVAPARAGLAAVGAAAARGGGARRAASSVIVAPAPRARGRRRRRRGARRRRPSRGAARTRRRAAGTRARAPRPAC